MAVIYDLLAILHADAKHVRRFVYMRVQTGPEQAMEFIDLGQCPLGSLVGQARTAAATLCVGRLRSFPDMVFDRVKQLCRFPAKISSVFFQLVKVIRTMPKIIRDLVLGNIAGYQVIPQWITCRGKQQHHSGFVAHWPPRRCRWNAKRFWNVNTVRNTAQTALNPHPIVASLRRNQIVNRK